ncbi:MAG: nitroreductase family protein [Firmicutes bacterium]|nr:nitroreductase family protein [Bacillota bacterium]
MKVKNDFATSTIDVLTAIRERRSIRRFTSEPVSELHVNTILEAGLSAPTAKNKRPFHFLVVKDQERLTKIAKGKTHAWMVDKAPCALVILGDKGVEDRPEYLYADCFAATQNILLAIHGLNLGGVWCGVGAGSSWYHLLKEELELPEHIEPMAVVALGHPAEEKDRPQIWEQEKIHWEKWGS